jgi:c-di-GMP-related signal transduction protein
MTLTALLFEKLSAEETKKELAVVPNSPYDVLIQQLQELLPGESIRIPLNEDIKVGSIRTSVARILRDKGIEIPYKTRIFGKTLFFIRY